MMADYPGTSTTKRSSAVKIMLHPDMAQKLRELADHLGQTPATLASIAVSQYVAQQTMTLGVTERAMESFFSHIAPDVLAALQKLLGSAGEAGGARKLKVVEEQPDEVDFFPEPPQTLDIKSGQSAAEALAEVLKKSAAIAMAEESSLATLPNAAAEANVGFLARSAEEEMGSRSRKAAFKALAETPGASDSLVMARKATQREP